MTQTFETLANLLRSDRSYRRFRGDRPVSRETLTQLVWLTTLCASGRNAQPLRYRLVTDEAEREALYTHLKWAGYLKDWDGPIPEERPTAYLVQCLDTQLGADCLCDDGLQLQAITLGATALGLGGCIIKAFNAKAVADVLAIPERYKPRYVLALGEPVETVVLEPMQEGNIEYWRTPDGVHHVPKRAVEELIIG